MDTYFYQVRFINLDDSGFATIGEFDTREEAEQEAADWNDKPYDLGLAGRAYVEQVRKA